MGTTDLLFFSRAEVAKAVGIRPHLLSQWVYEGLVRPFRKLTGTGRKNEYTFNDIISIALMTRLVNIGLARENASAISRAWLRRLDKDLEQQQRVVSMAASYLEELKARRSGQLSILDPPSFPPFYLLVDPIAEDNGGEWIFDREAWKSLYDSLDGERMNLHYLLNMKEVIKEVVDYLFEEGFCDES